MSNVSVDVNRRGENHSISDIRVVADGSFPETYEFSLFLDPDFSDQVLVERGKVTFTGYGDIRAIYLVLSIPHLGVRKEIGSHDFGEIQSKLDSTMASWRKKIATENKRVEKEENKNIAKKKTEDASTKRLELYNLLSNQVQNFRSKSFKSLAPSLPSITSKFDEKEPIKPNYPKKPVHQAPEWAEPNVSLLQKLAGQSQNIIATAKKEHAIKERDTVWAYESAIEKYDQKIKKIDADFLKELSKQKVRRIKQEKDVCRQKEIYEESAEKHEHYAPLWQQQNPSAVIFFVSELLAYLNEYESFSGEFTVDYQEEERLLIIEYELPNPTDMPDLKSCRYVISDNEFRETKIGKIEHKNLYESVCYQIALAVVHGSVSKVVEIDFRHLRAG